MYMFAYKQRHRSGMSHDELSNKQALDSIWLYLDAEVLVLPPVFLPQDSVFVGCRLRRHPTLAALGLAET